MSRPPKEGPNSLPEYTSVRPRRWQWDRPTAWLLGTQILSSLRQLVLSSIHTGFDMRDWMVVPRPFPIAARRDELWLDFFADTGDAPALVYCVAQAVQQPLDVVLADGSHRTLPRGELLVIGGDSAYPVADLPALRERLQAPMVWACEKVHGTAHPPGDPIPVFAIPGNHDYFDELNGFARQFRVPATAEGTPSLKHGEPPPLRFPGYGRVQDASYFAIDLPFGWQLWGVDLGRDLTKAKPIDTRQQEFFRGLPAPRKLILVTSVPVAVHGAPTTSLSTAIEDQLGLDAAFARDGRLRPGCARLDLSGDVHLYERYWGETVEDHAVIADRDPDPPAAPHYAAVTSGLGGAFHHPVQVREGTLRRQAAWPSEDESARAIGRVLLRPRKVFQAGSVGVLGAMLGAMFFLLGRCDGPAGGEGVLAAPRLLAGQRRGLGVPFADFGRLLLFIAAIAGWGVLLWWIRRRTRAIRERLIADRADQPAIQRWLHERLTTTAGPVLRWFGANPRVTLSVLLQLPWWVALWAAFYGLIRLEGLRFFSLGERAHLGTHVAVALVLVAVVGLPFLANSFRWRRLLPFLAVGLLHAVSQILTPYLWASATAALLGPPLLLLVGYWSLRPLLATLLESRRRALALTIAWPCLVVLALGAPLLFPHGALHDRGPFPWVVIGIWFVLVNVAMAIAWFQLARELRAEAVEVDEARERRRRWMFLAGMVPLQALALYLMTETADVDAADGTRFAIGLGAAMVAGAVFSCLWLGWYFLVCLQWGWHGNEAGSVARVDDYAELLRIRLTADTAEVWALAVASREDKDGDYTPRPRVIDHFTVRTSSEGTS